MVHNHHHRWVRRILASTMRMLMVTKEDHQQVYDGCCDHHYNYYRYPHHDGEDGYGEDEDDDVASSPMIMRWLVAAPNTSSDTTTGAGVVVLDHDSHTASSIGTGTDLLSDPTGNSSPSPTMLTENLIAALWIYVPIWLVGLTIYCVVRRFSPRTYAVRQWVVKIRTKLADDQFGYLSWLWRVHSIADEELLHEIGLDALCFLRLIRMGLRLSLIGMFNSLWLIPVYITVAVKGDQQESGGHTNSTASNSTSTSAASTGTTVRAAADFSIIAFDRLHKNELYYICTVLASYVFFGYAFYTILKEFRWFVRQRHAWLTKLRPQNYTILVRNIPPHLRSDITLQEHYNRLYGAHRVLSAHCCLFLHHLEAKVQKRTVCLHHLERAVAVFQMRGKRPTHMVTLPHSVVPRHRRYKSLDVETKQVDSIDAYTRELATLDEAIAQNIRTIQHKSRPKLMVKGSAFRSFDTTTSSSNNNNSSSLHSNNNSISISNNNNNNSSILLSSRSSSLTARRSSSLNEPTAADDTTATMDTSTRVAPITEAQNINNNNDTAAQARANALWAANRARANDRRHRTRAKIKAAVRIASATITGETDGTPDDAGFVTFTSLVAMHGALQMKQHSDLFAMETDVAPEPSEIFWNYVGKDRGVLQTGRLISLAMTIALCLFWTFIVSFIVGLTDPDHLANALPAQSKNFLDQNLWIAKFLKVLSPVLLLIFNSGLLPIILKAVSRFECPASDSVLEASAFWKMAAFTVIQTFLYVDRIRHHHHNIIMVVALARSTPFTHTRVPLFFIFFCFV
jgi:Late exocytosis, associated with Golgi transport/Cytosolic domain of 10TM putative phosphate transporter/Calcium-dependent channel, 7TM region, putative phosphate